MKFSKTACLLFTLLATTTASSNGDSDLICVEEPTKECYPRVFEPTKEWQIVKKGQEIPGGKLDH